jgi:DNA primase
MYGSKIPALSSYFSQCRMSPLPGKDIRAHDLPRDWKSLPSATETMSFMLGWFSGYFAADGHVAKSGNQATLYSANRENLNFVKGVCYRLGIRVSPINLKKRKSGGCAPDAVDNELFALSFAVRDVPSNFWLKKVHRTRVERWMAKSKGRQTTQWSVVSVVDKGERDEVFCAVVPGVEKFTLADNLMTMNCPYCGDTRSRLYVNYRWGCVDPITGEPMWHLACCYNADCLQEHFYEFKERVLGFLNESTAMLLAESVNKSHAVVSEADYVLGPTGWPGDVTLISELPRRHEASLYLRNERNFDLAELAKVWNVSLCTRAYTSYRSAEDRIIGPIMVDGDMVGWQGRYVGEKDWKKTGITKYFTLPGFPKSRVLYNQDLAADHSFVVVVEGMTDVWAIGGPTVGLLGKTMSQHQMKLLSYWAKKGGLLILGLDPEAWTAEQPDPVKAEVKRRELMNELNDVFDSRMVELKFPKGRDPAKLGRVKVRELIRDQVRAAGFKPPKFTE